VEPTFFTPPLTLSSSPSLKVVFPYEDKLGMLLEKCDETDPKKGGKVERTMVKMVIEGGAAEMRGVQLGSKVVSLNGRNAVGMAYQETLNLVKKLPRPLTVVLEQVAAFRDAAQGVCYTRKDMGQGPPTSWEAWKPQYFVIGGAVAKPFVLQLYDSKRDYEEVSLRGGGGGINGPETLFIVGVVVPASFRCIYHHCLHCLCASVSCS